MRWDYDDEDWEYIALGGLSKKSRASENPINNKQSQLKRKKMAKTNETTSMAKTYPGTSKPSGAGVGKGGPKQSPTGGNTTKGKGSMKKGGSVKKGK